ncbi:hypothetical protein [Polaromonas sp. A23]|uniref:hypothetical protein n=1 Tax=Polaromonas sp. A23 TaxID=1944133 RepID=UPI00111588EB|nr:hypothetical protein [Polaromonas sp. A23]
MRLALITIVFLLHSQTFAAAPIATDKPAKKAVASAHPPGATATRMKFQPSQEAVRLNTAHSTPQTRQTAQNPSDLKDTNEAEGEGLPYGTLLATLVLMAAIAVRRSRAGRP